MMGQKAQRLRVTNGAKPANSINELLVSFETTMEDSDHDKSLMRKPLLESGRTLRGARL